MLAGGASLGLGEFVESSHDNRLQRLAGLGDDGNLQMLDVPSGEQLWTRKLSGKRSTCRLSPDGALLVIATENQVSVVAADDGEVVQELPGISLEDLVWSQDGKTLLLATSGTEKKVHWWRREDWSLLGAYSWGCLSSACDFEVSADSTRLLVLSTEGRRDDTVTHATLIFREPAGRVAGFTRVDDYNGQTARLSTGGELFGLSCRHGGSDRQTLSVVHASGRILGDLPVHLRDWLYPSRFEFDRPARRVAVWDSRGVVVWCLSRMRESEPLLPSFRGFQVHVSVV